MSLVLGQAACYFHGHTVTLPQKKSKANRLSIEFQRIDDIQSLNPILFLFFNPSIHRWAVGAGPSNL
jgi:hypothetical protein